MINVPSSEDKAYEELLVLMVANGKGVSELSSITLPVMLIWEIITYWVKSNKQNNLFRIISMKSIKN